MASKHINSSKYSKNKFAGPLKTNFSLDAHSKQPIAEAVDKWSVENERVKIIKNRASSRKKGIDRSEEEPRF